MPYSIALKEDIIFSGHVAALVRHAVDTSYHPTSAKSVRVHMEGVFNS